MAIHPDAREQLAQDQAALIAALAARREPPPGFDTARLQAAADSLASKRARAAARAWPGLAESFGARYQALFLDYSAQTTLPRDGGPLADARAFVRYLQSRNELTDDVRQQILTVDLRFKLTSHGLVPRRLPSCRIAWFRSQQLLVVGIWSPVFGERSFALTFGRRR
jgi:hypothetical protein